jgi:hypothetical protein
MRYKVEKVWELMKRLGRPVPLAFLKELGFIILGGIILAAMAAFFTLEPWEKWGGGGNTEPDVLILKKGAVMIVTEEDGIMTIRTVEQDTPDAGSGGIARHANRAGVQAGRPFPKEQ